MMKTLTLFLLLAAFSLAGFTGSAAATGGLAAIELTTVTEGWKHSPNHVMAIWVTDAKTNFITTVFHFGEKRNKYLYTWNSARKNNANVDGTSGATLREHGSVNAMWNCRDRNDAVAPDGTYLFWVEFTEGNSQGPKAVFPFRKGPKAETNKPANLDNFKNIKVTFTPEK